MARAEACAKIFRGAGASRTVADAQKNRGKPGYFRQFSLYTARAIPYDANERPQGKSSFAGVVHGKSEKELKGELWQS